MLDKSLFLFFSGVAGFRFDASKHMWPGDLQVIGGMLSDLPTSKGFPAGSRPLIYQEVIDQGQTISPIIINRINTISIIYLTFTYFVGGEPIKASEYFGIGRVTEFKYGRQLSNVFHQKTALKYLANWGVGWGMMPDGNALVFIDNHDNQRGHGGGGDLLTFREPKLYKVFK